MRGGMGGGGVNGGAVLDNCNPNVALTFFKCLPAGGHPSAGVTSG